MLILGGLCLSAVATNSSGLVVLVWEQSVLVVEFSAAEAPAAKAVVVVKGAFLEAAAAHLGACLTQMAVETAAAAAAEVRRRPHKLLAARAVPATSSLHC